MRAGAYEPTEDVDKAAVGTVKISTYLEVSTSLGAEVKEEGELHVGCQGSIYGGEASPHHSSLTLGRGAQGTEGNHTLPME